MKNVDNPPDRKAATRLHVLIVEDRPLDAELVVDTLQRAGFELVWDRVETEAGYRAALDRLPDLILSDYSLPRFSGLRALELLHERSVDIPFIMISATIGEEQAVEAIRLGASDYLLKDRLERLGVAVANVLEQKQLRLEKQEAETRLRAAQSQLRAILDHSPSLMFSKDTAGRYLEINRAFEINCNVSAAQVLGKRDDQIFPPEQARTLRANDCAVLQAERALEFEETTPHPDGPRNWIVHKFPLRDDNGRIYGTGGIATDNTARKQAEARYRATFEQAAIGISHTTFEGRFLKVNQALCAMLGYTEGELLALTVIDITHPDEQAASREVRRKLQANPSAIHSPAREKRYLTRDGRTLWVMVSTAVVRRADGGIDYLVGTVQDISSQKTLAEHLRATFDQAAVGIVHVDPQGRYLRVNDRFCEIVGWSREDLVGNPALRITHPEDSDPGVTLINRLLDTGAQSATREKRYLRRDGAVVWTSMALSMVRRADGEPDYCIGMVTDITDRKRLENRMQQTFEQAAVGIARADLERNILDVNRRFCEITGYSRDELLQMTLMQISHPDDLNMDVTQRIHLLGGDIDHFQSEKRYVRKNGEVMWVRRTTSLARDVVDNSLHYIVVVEDITERKAVEESYRATFDHAPVGIMHSAADRRILHVNPKLCEILGYTREELLTMTTADILPPEYLESDRPKFLKQMIGGELQTYSSARPYVRKDGSIVWTNRTVSLVKDPAGRPLYFLRVIEDITERRLAERRIQRLNSLYNALSQTNATIVRVSDRNELFPAICRIAVEQGGLTTAWIGMVDPATGEGYVAASAGANPDYVAATRPALSPAPPTNNGPSGTAMRENRPVICNDIAVEVAREPWCSRALANGYRAAASLPLRCGGRVVGVLALLSTEIGYFDEDMVRLLQEMAGDISFALDGFEWDEQHRRAQQALEESDEKFHQLAHNIPQVFWITDIAQRRLIYVSPACEAITGRTVAQLQAKPRSWIDVVHEHDREQVKNARRTRAPLGTYDMEYRVVHSDGSVRWIHDRAFPVCNREGEPYRIAGIAEDVTERRQAEERLLQLAHYDNLTSLPNRVLFRDRLEQAVTQARRNGWTSALLIIDLDRFKYVNDTLGHTLGDGLLQQVSERLTGCVRSGDTVGRLGGDEFAVVLSKVSAPQDAGKVAQKILHALKQAFQLDGNEVFVTGSVGIALYPSDGEDIDLLTRNADAAMYSAKGLGRNNYQYYTEDMNRRTLERMKLDAGMRRALERGEFVLHYQPRINIVSGEIAGLEALLRWQPPGQALVPPNTFIPLLEETGLIVQVGEWVLEATCAQLRAWCAAGITPVPVAINMSARQFMEKDLGITVAKILATHDIDPRLVEIEITESALMQDPELATAALEKLQTLGLRIAVDDFGTGYSSLAYLKRFPLDALKIDRSFVRDITTDADDAAIAKAVITMAHSLNLKVVAEGVETAGQLAFLAANRCDEAQGYLYSPPVAADDCAKLLRNRHNLPHAPAAGLRISSATMLLADNEDCSTALAQQLRQDGYTVMVAHDADQALDLLTMHDISLIVADQNLADMPGMEFFRRVKLMYPAIPRILLTADTDSATVTAALASWDIHRCFLKQRDETLLRAEIQSLLTHFDPDAVAGTVNDNGAG